ncbi:MAG: alpha-amylase family glycosyl hydrolase, partial [Melioribacteraceae bacterium]|nr:alpha-amylase family glycosyl hydrolase [Melioribacteraceae bacterium]
MKKNVKVYLILFYSLMFVSCSNETVVEDIISPLTLVSGIADSIVISDLFYADNYKVQFQDNENLNIDHDSQNNILILKPDEDFEGMTLLEFEADMNLYHIPVISKKEKFYEFSFKPDKKYDKLNLFGSFNGWNRTNLPMTDDDGDGVYTAEVALDPGVHQYKFFADGLEIEDPLNSQKVPNGFGAFNNIRTIDDPNSSKFYLHIDEYYSKNPQSIFSFYLEDELEGDLTVQNIFVLLDNSKISGDKISLEGNYLSINFNYDELADQTLRVAATKSGRVTNIQTIKLENGKPTGNSSFNWNDAIIYSLMIDRFNDGDESNNNPVIHDSLSPKANYMGGDLKGVITKLHEGYFESLGINVIWISPVYDNPNEAFKEFPAPHRYYSGYHGYWPISAREIDPRYGT